MSFTVTPQSMSFSQALPLQGDSVELLFSSLALQWCADFPRVLSEAQREHLGLAGPDAALEARIESYELAFRMQQSIPEIVDFSQETAATQALYGLDQPHCRDFGMQLLAARRLVERGVRFIQIQHGAGGVDGSRIARRAGADDQNLGMPRIAHLNPRSRLAPRYRQSARRGKGPLPRPSSVAPNGGLIET